MEMSRSGLVPRILFEEMSKGLWLRYDRQPKRPVLLPYTVPATFKHIETMSRLDEKGRDGAWKRYQHLKKDKEKRARSKRGKGRQKRFTKPRQRRPQKHRPAVYR